LPDGRSLLWEAIGKKFTGLSYQDADRLSRQNKEFIKELFPASDIYVSLFPDRTQRVVGEVAPDTRGVKRMLERVGFRYVERIDPFDGGPHYETNVDDISVIKLFRAARLEKGVPAESEKHWLVAYQPSNGRNRFRAVKATAEFAGNQVRVDPEVRDHLQAPVGARLALIPFD
jgi:arginine N-succinyltransferase